MNFKINKEYLPLIVLLFSILVFAFFANYYFVKRDLSHLRQVDRWRKENHPSLQVLLEQTSKDFKIYTTIEGHIGILNPFGNSDLANNLKGKIEALEPPYQVVIVNQ